MAKPKQIMTQKKAPVIILVALLTIILGFGCKPNVKEKSKLPVKTYTPVDKALYNTIIQQDSLLFEAFNARKFDEFKSFFSKDLEIYQDNTGLRNYDQSMEAFQGLFKMNYILKRQLIKESVEVYPIKDYGAIEIGQHIFCHTENGKPDCGTYKFVHIWKNQDGHWEITKIVTYDHK